MAETRSIIKVFLASPGDLGDERIAAKKAVEETNTNVAVPQGFSIELLGWEDTVARFGRPQALINSELDSCELVIGVIWKRWGTPPTRDGRFTSGFEEEYQRSVERRKKTGMPEISLLFKDVQEDLLNDPGSDLQKVLAFQQQIIADKALMYETFSDTSDFAAKIRRLLAQYVNRLVERRAALKDDHLADTEGKSAPDKQSSSREPDKNEHDAAEFFSRIATCAKSTEGLKQIDAVDIARLRFLAATLQESGNNAGVFGVHDAHILYQAREKTHWTTRDISALVSAGLEHHNSENAPIWHWLWLDDNYVDRLSFASAFGSTDARRVGALKALRLIAAKPFISEQFDDEWMISNWLGADRSDRVREEALKYLSEIGTEENIPIIQDNIDQYGSRIKRSALEAIVAILLRYNKKQAAVEIVGNQFESFDSNILELAIDQFDVLDSKILRLALGHSCAEIRHAAVVELNKRGNLLEIDLRALAQDKSVKVRTTALAMLESQVGAISIDDAKEFLIRPPTKSGFNLLATNDEEGEKVFKWHSLDTIAKRSISEIKTLELGVGIEAEEAYFALAINDFEKNKNKMIEGIKNKFEVYQNQYDTRLIDLIGKDRAEKYITRDKATRDYLENRRIQLALKIICNYGKKAELEFVRESVDNNLPYYAEDMISYLSKYGSAEDIPRIAKCTESIKSGGLASLMISTPRSQEAALEAILKLVGPNAEKIFDYDLKNSLIAGLISEISMASFRRISPLNLLKLLNDVDEKVRRNSVLRIVECYNKDKQQEILDKYVLQDEYYYNVVYWLDFGVTVTRKEAIRGVRSEMSRSA